MTLIFEADLRFNACPGYFESRIIYRVWWLWFAVSLLRVPFDEFVRLDKAWLP